MPTLPTTDKRTPSVRPVESTTRVTIAFPFGSIRMGAAADTEVQALAQLVADLAAALDKVSDDDAFLDLASRARELADSD